MRSPEWEWNGIVYNRVFSFWHRLVWCGRCGAVVFDQDQHSRWHFYCPEND